MASKMSCASVRTRNKVAANASASGQSGGGRWVGVMMWFPGGPRRPVPKVLVTAAMSLSRRLGRVVHSKRHAVSSGSCIRSSSRGAQGPWRFIGGWSEPGCAGRRPSSGDSAQWRGGEGGAGIPSRRIQDGIAAVDCRVTTPPPPRWDGQPEGIQRGSVTTAMRTRMRAKKSPPGQGMGGRVVGSSLF